MNAAAIHQEKTIAKSTVEIKERHFDISAEEEQEHVDFMQKNLKNPLWLEDEVNKDA